MDEDTDVATAITVSYPADLSERGREIVEGTAFRSYLRRAHETASVGDEWAEFVGVGCCGDTLDVPLVVEAVEGGSRLDDTTDVVYEERDSCEYGSAWEVQSRAGP